MSEYVYVQRDDLKVFKDVTIGDNVHYFVGDKEVYRQLDYDFESGDLRTLKLNKDEFFKDLISVSMSVDDGAVRNIMNGMKMTEIEVSGKIKDAILDKHPDYEFVRLDNRYIIMRDTEDKMNLGGNIARASKKKGDWIWKFDYHGLLNLNKMMYHPYSKSDNIDYVEFERDT